jgi:hypothetical protein
VSFTVIALFKFHEGKLDELKRLPAQCMEIVRTKDIARCNTTSTSTTISPSAPPTSGFLYRVEFHVLRQLDDTRQ